MNTLTKSVQKTFLVCIAAAPFALPALADNATADFSGINALLTVGPIARMPKREKEDKQELETFFAAWGSAWKAGDAEVLASMVDFPVLMLTDDAIGNYNKAEMTQEQWLGLIRPTTAKAQAKDSSDHRKWSHTGSCFILSDALASCEGEASVSGDSLRGEFRHQMLMIRTASGWKIKSMVEAGWGNMHTASASNDLPLRNH